MMTKDEADLTYARGIIADCCHHSDTAIIAACDTILMLDGSSEDAERARELRATLSKSAA
ncbi:hypothetical protein [Sulfitobacter sp. W074]|uniref:hypothetical protein n=1 Tax=Sulfitobacter sp. W074 TaxID=2867026 RepID=UPI0021A65C91|nr:hypothetical protein [Sulfitobacter sp. W074]UWR36177.1 hypothetical protein K3762_10180 [Sulfitobacter sp. W074]